MLMWLFSVVKRERIIDGCCYWLSETENKGRAQGRVSNEKLTSKYAKNFRIYDTFSDRIYTYATIHTSAHSPHHYPRAEYY